MHVLKITFTDIFSIITVIKVQQLGYHAILTYLGDLKFRIAIIEKVPVCIHGSVLTVDYCCRFRPEYKMCYQGKVAGCGLNLVFLSTLGTTQSTADFLCGEGNSGKPFIELCRSVHAPIGLVEMFSFNILRRC